MVDRQVDGKDIANGRCRWKDGAGRHVFLVEPFVEPDIMRGRGVQRGGVGDVEVVLCTGVCQGRVAEDVPGVGLPFEIEKGFYGKEDAVHSQEEGVEQDLM